VEPHAERVAVSGEFNGWSTDTTFLKKQKDGLWETTLALPPGRHEYKFVVDGQWIPDPKARQQASNGYGTLNSVLEVER
jgi:1,4-alpha-glucan branching enzyme